MRTSTASIRRTGVRTQRAFTLTEVVVSIGIAAFTVGGVVACYLLAAQRAEWASASAAAHRAAMLKMEQWRGARWDQAVPDDSFDRLLAGGSPVTLTEETVLDMPITGPGEIRATNLTTLTVMPDDPPRLLIEVECVWSMPTRGPFTNRLTTLRAPDQ
jgi:type II secretory pathway pseudopilin PulG